MKPILPCWHYIGDHKTLSRLLAYYAEIQVWEEENGLATKKLVRGFMGLHAERYRIKLREVIDITIVMRVLKK